MNGPTQKTRLPQFVEKRVNAFSTEFSLYQKHRRISFLIDNTFSALFIGITILIGIIGAPWTFRMGALVTFPAATYYFVSRSILRPRKRWLKREAPELLGLLDREDNPQFYELLEAVSRW